MDVDLNPFRPIGRFLLAVLIAASVGLIIAVFVFFGTALDIGSEKAAQLHRGAFIGGIGGSFFLAANPTSNAKLFKRLTMAVVCPIAAVFGHFLIARIVCGA